MKTFISSTLVIAVLAALCAAADLTLDEITAGIEAAEKNTTSLEFSFKQEIIYNLTKEKQDVSGRVTYMKPENILIKQNGPLVQEITTNGKKVWIYTPKYKQVIVDSWKKWTSNSFVPASLINFGNSFKELKKRYEVSSEGKEEGRYALLLKPYGGENYKMKLWVDASSFIPVKMMIYGDNFNITTEMTDVAVNSGPDKKIFVFKAPAGTEVLELP